jgi:hypothetical protein
MNQINPLLCNNPKKPLTALNNPQEQQATIIVIPEYLE